ncbi:hypothetical protein AB0368_28665 [Actinoplanes sp. NPDC051475]|uniref:hypothetical protein n=1 Tax=Actinoplanes sp. NPDC051475 TaxID=3157225 RepID=UPI003450B50A
MNTDRFPRPPIDREQIARIRGRLRQQIRNAPPAKDPLTRELQQNVANGVRGRDLLSVDAYREHFAAHAEELTERLRRVREDLDEQAPAPN